MATTPRPDKEPTLADVIRRLDEITADLEKREQWQNKVSLQTEQWQDRTWDAVKWAIGLSAALSISAAVGLLGLVIRAALKGGWGSLTGTGKTPILQETSTND
jgi:hypothetical protein